MMNPIFMSENLFFRWDCKSSNHCSTALRTQKPIEVMISFSRLICRRISAFGSFLSLSESRSRRLKEALMDQWTRQMFLTAGNFQVLSFSECWVNEISAKVMWTVLLKCCFIAKNRLKITLKKALILQHNNSLISSTLQPPVTSPSTSPLVNSGFSYKWTVMR